MASGFATSQPPSASVSSDALRQRAIALQKQGQIAQAITLYQQALAVDRCDVSAMRCLGTAYKASGRLDLAADCFRRTLALQPAFPEAWNNLGNVLSEQGHFDRAAECFQRAFALKPDFAGAHFNFALALGWLGRFDEAVNACRRAVALVPTSAEFHNALGMALYDAHRIDEALAAYEHAIRLRPDYAAAHYNRAHAWLLLGDYERGWPEHEWRLKLPNVQQSSFGQPRWDGSHLPNATILVEAEQGLGDTIQFVRYLPLVKERVGTVVLRCQAKLAALLQKAPGIDHLISKSEAPPAFDVWTPLMSLPLYFGRSLDAIPRSVPYLEADESLVHDWQSRLREIDGFRIAIHWQGNPAFPKDRFRSIPLSAFEPVARIPGVRLLSVQKGTGHEQLTDPALGFPVIDLGLPMDEIHGPFRDTAAILRCVDLVVTSDTSLAHLAGTLAVPTWLAVPRIPEWRWHLTRPDTPWYPTLTLFRQTHVGDWSEMFTRMAERLQRWELGIGNREQQRKART